VRRGYGLIIALALILAACGSGPSLEALARNEPPPTTTTTTIPPEGVVVVTISNGTFKPSLLELNLDEQWLVRWVNEDDRAYTLFCRGVFESPELTLGDTWEFDFRTVEPDVFHYSSMIGNGKIPGTIDTQPER
jgi:hypothetical protein